jgi:superfamily II DNA or RNA helicase
MRLIFDRGTLVLSDVPPGLRPSALPGVVWDPRVLAFRASAHRRPALELELARLDPAFEVWPSLPPVEGWAAVELRPYQEAALEAWEAADRRGVVVLPTGAGKTRMAIAAAARVGAPTLVLAPTRVLLAQWHAELSRWFTGPVGQLGDGVREAHPITVATFESAWRHMARLGDRFELLIVDEAHHFGRGLRDEALEMCAAPLRLGLTGTPPDGEPMARLEGLLGPIVYELGVGDLTGSWLAPFGIITITLDLDPAERAEYEALRTTYNAAARPFFRAAPEAAWSDFVRACRGSKDGLRALEAWRRSRALVAFTRAKARAVSSILARHRDARVLVFTADNATAYAIARDRLIMPITCDVPRAERALALARFSSGELRALVSARVLNEGVDVPDADVGVVVGASQGEREHAQRVGRLLRPGPGKRALVYELVTRDTGEARQAARRSGALAARKTAAL